MRDGELVIDIEGKPTVALGRHFGFTVILMIEGATVTPTGDAS